MKKIAKSGFLLSDKDRLSNIVKGVEEEDSKDIGLDEYPYVLPRVFPNSRVPIRVSINRLLK